MAKILIVDDRPIDREFLTTLLGYGGHRLFEAADGAEALTIAGAERPDLIISDILMPTMDGYEFARRLRADPEMAAIPMVFYTANFREREARTLAQTCGVSRVLAKPAAPEAILETVQAMLGLPAGAPPLPAELRPPLPAGHLGALNEQLADYGDTTQESASQLMATVSDPHQALAEERERVHEIASELSKTVDHLQAISLRLTLLVEKGIELSAERDPARLLEIFCRCAQELCVAKYAVAARIEGAGLRHLAVRGIDTAALGDFAAPPAASVLGLALAERRPQRLAKLTGTAADRTVLGLPAAHPLPAAFLAAPIASGKRGYGWLYLADKLGGDEFSEIDEQMVMTLATQVAINYENLDLYAELAQHSARLEREVSERTLAEAEIRRLNTDLEHRIGERTAELAQANEALLKSNLELQHFAHVAAHDLQTPLRSIASFTQLLHQELQGRLEGEAGQWIEHVVRNTRRMQTLIQDLLAYSRLDSQARPQEATDFRLLLDEVLSTLAGPISDTGAEVSCDGELPTLLADRTQIAQVLQNLIENGIKYNRAKPPRVWIAARRQGAEWLFSVRDNGIGIEPRHHERIFELFRRLHTQKDYPGTGIGLAICRRVVERHGGRIWIESQPGEGCTFLFTLPADPTP